MGRRTVPVSPVRSCHSWGTCAVMSCVLWGVSSIKNDAVRVVVGWIVAGSVGSVRCVEFVV